jgi:hypothetical protein
MIAGKLAALGTVAATSADTGGPAREVEAARPAGAVRVSEADPRWLGVHAAITVPGVPDDVPPEYVPRDADAAEFGVRARVAAAAQRSGFVLLVGGSSVGKTRCAVEAVKELLPDWWLVHPAGSAEVAALTQASFPRLLVWLDELQRYLDGEHGLTGAVVRALLNAPHPAVIIGTLWPDRYTAYTTVPGPGTLDLYAREREVLDLATVIRIDPAFSPAEQDRAHAAAARDLRLRVALEATGYGLTQTLAAAPQLVARWQDAKAAAPYAWAVLTAALDATRLGARAPLSADLLRSAAPGYCTSQQQAEAPEDWFEQARAYATGKLHGAVAALSPAGGGMGQVAGYIAADYLIQHASRERRYARVPASTWDATLSHLGDPGDAARLADSAKNRLLYRYAIPLYRHAAADDGTAAQKLAGLLKECGDLDGAIQVLRARHAAGDRNAAWRLAILRLSRPAQAGADDQDATRQLAELRARADAGNGNAASHLARLLAERGDLDELAELLAERGDLDQAEQIWRARADAGDILDTTIAAGRLAELLLFLVDIVVLRGSADAGNGNAASHLARLLARRGDLDELRARADAGNRDADAELARLLARRGDLDELRARADAGNGNADAELARLLAERGDLDELRARINAGNGNAAFRLGDLLIKKGRGEEAERLRRFGLNPDGSIASE